MFGSDWPVCKVARAEHSQVSKKIHVQTCEPTLQFIINSNDNPSTNAIAGGGPADGAGLRPLQGGEGEDLLLQRHQVLQSKDLTCL